MLYNFIRYKPIPLFKKCYSNGYWKNEHREIVVGSIYTINIWINGRHEKRIDIYNNVILF